MLARNLDSPHRTMTDTIRESDGTEDIPPVPAAYYGEVTLGDHGAPVGTTITAEIDGEQRGSITVEERGQYGESGLEGDKLSVSGTSEDEGKEVSFFAEGTELQPDPAVTWDSGATEEVALTADEFDTTTVERWQVDVDGRIQHATPAVDDDVVVAASVGESVYGLSDDGTAVSTDWQRTRSGALSDSGLVYADETVYVGSGGGLLYAFDAETGNDEWTYDSAEAFQSDGSALASTPALADGTVYVGANDGVVHAVAGGEFEWAGDVGSAVLSNLAVADGTVVVTTRSGDVVALDADDNGAELWRVETDGSFEASSPVIDDGTVYAASDAVYALSLTDGSEEWSAAFGGTSVSTPTVFDGAVHVGDDDGSVTAFDADTGDSLWETDLTDDEIATSPVVLAPDEVVHILAVSVNGEFGALSPDGEVETTVSIGDELGVDGAVRSSLVTDGNNAYLGVDETLLKLAVLL